MAAGNLDEAAAMLVRALQLNAEQGRHGYANRLLPQCARLAVRRGRDRLAAQLFGAASVDRGPMLIPLMLPEEVAEAEAVHDAVRARLGNKAFEACLAEGRTWSLVQAVEPLRRMLAGKRH